MPANVKFARLLARWGSAEQHDKGKRCSNIKLVSYLQQVTLVPFTLNMSHITLVPCVIDLCMQSLIVAMHMAEQQAEVMPAG